MRDANIFYFGDYIFSEVLNTYKYSVHELAGNTNDIANIFNNNSNYLVVFISYEFCKYTHSYIQYKSQNILPLIEDLPDIVIYEFQNKHCVSNNFIQDISLDLKDTQIHSIINDKDYADILHATKKEILHGNTYEINISRPWLIQYNNEFNNIDLFKYLKNQHKAPYAGYFEFNNEQALISMSPECLLKIINKDNKRIIHTYPIKGTSLPNQSASLHSNTKEMAEHLMVVDLHRNDLGQFCKAGTVKVNEFAKCKEFSYVGHLESDISGELEDNMQLWDILCQFLPSGSITGAPKPKTIEIINQLELYERKGYTGTMGYINPDGTCEFNVLIRSLFTNALMQQAVLNTGGGIVFDSDINSEINETYQKARGFV